MATAYLLVIAALYSIYGLWAIHAYGWRAVAADEWRACRRYLELTFPQSVLFLDNGHAPVFPALLQLAQIWWFNQIEQLQLGAALAAVTVVVIAVLVWADQTLSTFRRACCVALTSVAMLWLANARILMHGNASVMVYLLALSLVVALWRTRASVERARSQQPGACTHLTAAILGAAIATFCLGAGLGVFVAVLFVMIVQRAARAQLSLMLAGMLAAFAGYVRLAGAPEVSNSICLSPLDNLHVAARWLAGPAVHLIRPYHRMVATLAASAGGSPVPPWNPVWPAVGLGLGGILLLLGLTLSLWRSGALLNRTQTLGLGLAWFALATAGIVAVGRMRYFEIHPGEIYSDRYQSGASMLWLGLGLLALGSARTQWPSLGRLAQLLALSLPILALPTEVIMTRWAKVAQFQVNLSALGLIGGVLDASPTYAESLPADVLGALPGVRERGLSMFSWPVARLLGQRLDPDGKWESPAVRQLTITPVDNLLGGPASSVRFEVGAEAPALLLFLDHRYRVIGSAIRDVERPAGSYIGWLQGIPLPEGVTVVSWSEQALPFTLHQVNPVLDIPKHLARSLGVKPEILLR